MSESFKKVRFIASAPSLSSVAHMAKPSVMMVGRSNVGKSTLINGLVRQKIAFSSKKAGKTKALNLFLVDDSFYLVDSPGYGSTSFATLSTVQFSSLMEESLPHPMLKGVCLLLDSRRKPSEEDLSFLKWLASFNKPIAIVLTKCDTLSQKEMASAKKWVEELGFDRVLFSDTKAQSYEKIRAAIISISRK